MTDTGTAPTEAVLYSVEAGVATITLNQPDSRNAMTTPLMNGLGDHLAAAIADDAVRAIVLTNNGPAFCAGANLKQDDTDAPHHDLVGIFEMMLDGPKPVVGRIAGHCTGGGVGLAAGCDISIAADDVKLGFTEVRIGVAPAMISVVCLPKLRRADASELFLSGEKITAGRAAEVGLVNRAVPRAELDEAVDELVGKLVAGAPGGLAAAKTLISKVPDMDRADAFGWTAELSASLFRTDEAQAGMKAFRERRPAPWVPAGRVEH
jgi:methylglutaconyl-CoA hydratase